MSHSDGEEKSAFHISGKVIISINEDLSGDALSFEGRLRTPPSSIEFVAQRVCEDAHLLHQEFQEMSNKNPLIYFSY